MEVLNRFITKVIHYAIHKVTAIQDIWIHQEVKGTGGHVDTNVTMEEEISLIDIVIVFAKRPQIGVRQTGIYNHPPNQSQIR